MQNPLAKQRALLALRAQAARWLAAYKAALVARGLGFTPEDVAAVEAVAPARTRCRRRSRASAHVRLGALGRAQGDVPELSGAELRADDPRLAPVAGLSFPAYAIAAAAIGWATDDAALVARVTAALGRSARPTGRPRSRAGPSGSRTTW